MFSIRVQSKSFIVSCPEAARELRKAHVAGACGHRAAKRRAINRALILDKRFREQEAAEAAREELEAFGRDLASSGPFPGFTVGGWSC